MNFLKKFFGVKTPNSQKENKEEHSPFLPEVKMVADELFIHNFKKNGGKFLYCENLNEIKEQFENILEENDWFEKEVMCNESNLFDLLEDNKLTHNKTKNPTFLFVNCENLIAEEGSILFSSNQIKQYKPDELPVNIVVMANTSQIIHTKSDGLSSIKKKYAGDYPTNITTIKYFEETQEVHFTQSNSAKNLYLLLLENL